MSGVETEIPFLDADGVALEGVREYVGPRPALFTPIVEDGVVTIPIPIMGTYGDAEFDRAKEIARWWEYFVGFPLKDSAIARLKVGDRVRFAFGVYDELGVFERIDESAISAVCVITEIEPSTENNWGTIYFGPMQ